MLPSAPRGRRRKYEAPLHRRTHRHNMRSTCRIYIIPISGSPKGMGIMNPFDPYPEESPQPLVPSESYTYPPSLAHDLACCVSDEEIEAVKLKYEYDPAEFEIIINRTDFKREYSEWRQRLISEGNSFKLKLRAMAEEYLPQLHRIMNSEATAPSVKLSAFQYITKVASLEPEKVSEGEKNGTKIVIEIANYGSPAQPTTINVGEN